MKLKILNRDKRKINVFLYTTVFIKKCVIYVLKGNAVVYLENSLIWWQIKLFPEKKKDFVTCAIVRTVFKIWLATSRSHKLLPLTVNYFVDSRIQVDKLDVCFGWLVSSFIAMILKSAGLLTRRFLFSTSTAKMSSNAKKLQGQVAIVTASTDGYYWKRLIINYYYKILIVILNSLGLDWLSLSDLLPMERK